MSFPILIPDITVYAGDTFTSPSYVLESGSPLAPIDLVAAGWGSWSAQWRPSADSTQVVSLTVDSSQASSGIIRWTLDAASTRKLWNGVWDIQAVQSGATRTWLKGKIIFVEDITRV